MIEYILPAIDNAEDYLSALSLFKANSPLEAGEVDNLVALYTKYSDRVTDPDYAKLCLAVDLLPGRTRENTADFAALELGSNLDALLLAQELLHGPALTEDLTQETEELVTGDSVGEAAKVILARVGLDVMLGSPNIAQLQGTVRALAGYLSGLEAEVLDKYTVLVAEVKRKCRI